mmetsp:Transcript_8605/g.12842  ORF Transcript_8605/g.12842 Transcript_8605/m.12842 type:complete len:274 (-) Transcript_8605:207-1028(-)|eukprot:CAMPEP_0185019942 /NCGR_PEP_ID=MMETSP1103-20130426/2535_1 /TAXON_ID=36769 /ORGANISM="Paraphysomonas bandaiensis, Strain Caron Lab Isolate" /LENGTH=273 /DNA_ID=CAMNT_0027550527 /DNA_START=163 /DNA_END=984 /DNA_ORIENTATION=+
MKRTKSVDIPRMEFLKYNSIKAFRSARENRRKIFPEVESPDSRPPSRGASATRGYTGHIPQFNQPPVPTSPIRYKIRGYTGHIPGSLDVCGHPTVPGEEMQKRMYSPVKKASQLHNLPRCKYSCTLPMHGNLRPGHEEFVAKRYGSHDEMMKYYNDAITKLHERGQTQKGLLNIVQSKLSERVRSYAQQIIRIRKIFEYFDFDDSKTLDEYEFRQFLELSNCYLDDVQVVALFAYFDLNKSGGICWDEFAKNAMVQNPKGGTTVLPKAIVRNE